MQRPSPRDNAVAAHVVAHLKVGAGHDHFVSEKIAVVDVTVVGRQDLLGHLLARETGAGAAVAGIEDQGRYLICGSKRVSAIQAHWVGRRGDRAWKKRKV